MLQLLTEYVWIEFHIAGRFFVWGPIQLARLTVSTSYNEPGVLGAITFLPPVCVFQTIGTSDQPLGDRAHAAHTVQGFINT